METVQPRIITLNLSDEGGDPETGSTQALVENKGPPTSVVVPIFR